MNAISHELCVDEITAGLSLFESRAQTFILSAWHLRTIQNLSPVLHLRVHPQRITPKLSGNCALK
jgi:hypothetical protein